MKKIKALIKNFVLIRKLAKKYKISVFQIPFLSCGFYSHGYDRETGKLKSHFIGIPFLPTDKNVAVLFHELGHMIHPKGRDKCKRTAELSAWEAGFSLMRQYRNEINAFILGYCRGAFHSYLLDLPHSEQRKWLNRFDDAFERNYYARS